MQSALLTLSVFKSTGGPAKSIEAFRRALDAKVISWGPTHDSDLSELVWNDAETVPPTRLPMLRKLLAPKWRGSRVAERLVATSEVISCHAFWRWHNLWMHQMHRRHGIPYWFVPHGGLDPYVLSQGSAAKQAFLRLGGHAFLRDASAIVCSTQRELAKVRRLVGNCRGAVIPWPLNEDDFRPRDDRQRSRVRSELGIPPAAFTVLCFGRLHPIKQPLQVVEAIAALDDPTVHLIVMGNEYGVSHAACREHATNHGMAGQVHVVDATYGDARHQYFDAADLYISLSRKENFNFTAAESLAAGLPVILSPGNDLGPMLRGAGCGWILGSDDLVEAVAALRNASQMVARERTQMGQAGVEWVRANCSEREFAARVQLLARIVTGQEQCQPKWINPTDIAA